MSSYSCRSLKARPWRTGVQRTSREQLGAFILVVFLLLGTVCVSPELCCGQRAGLGALGHPRVVPPGRAPIIPAGQRDQPQCAAPGSRSARPCGDKARHTLPAPGRATQLENYRTTSPGGLRSEEGTAGPGWGRPRRLRRLGRFGRAVPAHPSPSQPGPARLGR